MARSGSPSLRPGARPLAWAVLAAAVMEVVAPAVALGVVGAERLWWQLAVLVAAVIVLLATVALRLTGRIEPAPAASAASG